jgi:S-DNA-T family DNA segregation ATPase FtsK/SpoIIIE
MPVALYAALETRFVMRMSDADDYVQAGLDAMKMRGVVLPAGRAVLPDATHVQVAQADTAAVAAAMADLAPGAPLGVLPAHASLDEHISRAQPLRPVMAVEELEIAPVDLPLDDGHVLVAGPPRTGRSTTLVTTASALRQASPELALYLLAPRRSPLSALDVWTAAAAGRDACEDLAGRLEDLLAGRTETSDPIVIVVDDAEELRDTSTDSALETLARRGRDLGVRLVIAADNAQAHRAYSGCIPEVRRDRTAVLLSPNLDLDGDLVGVRLPRRQLRWPVGRAYLVTGGAASLVQVLTAEVPKPSRRR